MVHDARDYDRAAVSIAQGEGWPDSRAPGARPRSGPPAYPVLLAGVYTVAGVHGRGGERPGARRAHPRHRHLHADRGPDRRGGGAAVGPPGRARRDGARRGLRPADHRRRRRDVGDAVRGADARRARRGDPAPALDPPLALGAARRRARRPDDPHAGERAGAAAAARARGLDRPAALLAARARRAGGARGARAAHRLAVDDPQRGRLRPLHPRVDPARLGARGHLQRPGARWTRRTRPRGARSATSPPTASCTRGCKRDPRARGRGRASTARSKAYIREHPTYVAKVALWTTLRTLELAGLRLVAPHRVDDQHPRGLGRRGRRSASGSSPCSRWPARRRRRPAARRCGSGSSRCCSTSSVVFLVVETPRYRTGIDPFIVMLAALAVTPLRRTPRASADHARPRLDRARYPTSPTDRTPA